MQESVGYACGCYRKMAGRCVRKEGADGQIGKLGLNLQGIEACFLTRCQIPSSALRPVLADSHPIHTSTNARSVVLTHTQLHKHAHAFCARARARPMTLGQSIPGLELPVQDPPSPDSQGNLSRGGKVFDDRKKILLACSSCDGQNATINCCFPELERTRAGRGRKAEQRGQRT